MVGLAALTTRHDYQLTTHPGSYFLGARSPSRHLGPRHNIHWGSSGVFSTALSVSCFVFCLVFAVCLFFPLHRHLLSFPHYWIIMAMAPGVCRQDGMVFGWVCFWLSFRGNLAFCMRFARGLECWTPVAGLLHPLHPLWAIAGWL